MSKDYLYYSDYLVLRIPVFGPIMQKILISNFCQTFSLLFSSGMNILKCLEIAGKTTTNVVMTHTFENIRDQVQAGTPVSAAINSSGEFPSLIVMMVKIGEDTGDLSGVLDQVVEFYDRDVNEAVDGMIAMIEPALTVVMGGIMLWIAAAVFGPVYDSFAKLAI
jgi:type IV pilus assembly protein PilC